MSLPLPRLDDRTWQDLRDEGVASITRFSPTWTDHNASDPGITFIELLAYQTEIELFRLDRITASHRRAFLEILRARHLPKGPRHASTLLTLDPTLEVVGQLGDISVKTGEYFVPRHTPSVRNSRHRQRRILGSELTINVSKFRKAAEPDEPMLQDDAVETRRVPEFGFRAAHDVELTGIQIAAIQSFDGRSFCDISDTIFRARSAKVWGDDPNDLKDSSTGREPALYIGLDLSKFRSAFDPMQQLKAALTLWCFPDGFGPADRISNETEFEPSACSVAPPRPQEFAPSIARMHNQYDPNGLSKSHHGLRVCWEYHTNAGWMAVPDVVPFRDETCGFTKSGRIVIPGVALENIEETAIGIIPASLFYLRCRLVYGRPDRAPMIRGLYADAILVEQWDQTMTHCYVNPPLLVRDLELEAEVEADVNDAATDLVRRGWGADVNEWRAWPLWGKQGFDPLNPGINPPLTSSNSVMNAIVLGVGNGEPNQKFVLPCPSANTLFASTFPDSPDDSPPIRILTDTLQVWTLEPPWSWKPSETHFLREENWRSRVWELVSDLIPGARTIPHFIFEELPTTGRSRESLFGEVLFGDGENGRVPSPGALVFASYSWSIADAANFGAGFIWANSNEREPFRPDRVTLFPKLRFVNPLDAEGGRSEETLPSALRTMANEFAAPENLVEFAAQARSNTLDGLDLSGMEPPSMAVSLIDFECLARNVPGTSVARSRAWVEFDPEFPEHLSTGAITITIVPSIPADRPEPTQGLIRRVRAFLDERRPVSCKVFVVGPEYVAIRIRAILHTSHDDVTEIRISAAWALKKYLHPTQGGLSGLGWPFGRNVYVGELMRILANVNGVKHVTGLQVATAAGEWTEEPIEIPQRSLIELIDPDLEVVRVA